MKVLFVQTMTRLPEGFAGDVSDALLELAKVCRSKAFMDANPIVSSDRREEFAADWNKKLAGMLPAFIGKSNSNVLDLNEDGSAVVGVIDVPLRKHNFERPISG